MYRGDPQWFLMPNQNNYSRTPYAGKTTILPVNTQKLTIKWLKKAELHNSILLGRRIQKTLQLIAGFMITSCQ